MSIVGFGRCLWTVMIFLPVNRVSAWGILPISSRVIVVGTWTVDSAIVDLYDGGTGDDSSPSSSDAVIDARNFDFVLCTIVEDRKSSSEWKISSFGVLFFFSDDCLSECEERRRLALAPILVSGPVLSGRRGRPRLFSWDSSALVDGKCSDFEREVADGEVGWT